MKNILLSLIIIFGFSLSAIAQPVLTFGEVTVSNGSGGCLPVYIGSNAAQGFPNALSIQNLIFGWDDAALTNVTFENLNPLMLGLIPTDFTSLTAGSSVMDWTYLECNEANNNAAGVSFPHVDMSMHVFDICFESATGDYGECLPIEIINAPNDPPIVHRSFTYNENTGECPNIGLIYDSGCIFVDVSPLEISVTSTTGNTGDFVCVDFSVEGFTGLTSVQFDALWDPAVLTPRPACSGGIIPGDNIENLGCSLFNTGFGDRLRVTWAATVNPPHGVSLDDGTVFFSACFDIIGECETATQFEIGSFVEISNIIMQETEIGYIFNTGSITVNDCEPIGLQLFADCGSPVNVNDQICIPVTVGDNFTSITQMDFLMEWNAQILTFDQVQNVNVAVPNLNTSIFSTNASNGFLHIEWNSVPSSLPEGSLLFEACFDVTGLGGSSPISFPTFPATVETNLGGGMSIGLNPNNCEVLVNQPESVTMTFGSGCGGTGEEFCVEVEIGSNFEQLTAFEYAMGWDFQLFQYQSSTISNFPVSAMTNDAAAVSSGILLFEWEDLVPLDIADGTVMLEICFTPLGTPGDVSVFTLDQIIVPVATSALQNGENIGIIPAAGELCTLFPEGFGIYIDQVTGLWQGSTTDTTCVSVSVESFDNITDVSLNINWDPTALNFVDFNNFGTWTGLGAAINTTNTGGGVLGIDWSNGGAPAIADGADVFEMCFELIGDASTCYPIEVSQLPEPTITTLNGQGSLIVEDGEICIQDRFIILDTLIIPVSCPGEANGEITLTIEGGQEPIFNRWYQNGNEQFMPLHADHLTADTVFVDISDSSNPPLSETFFFIIPQNTVNIPIVDAGPDVYMNCGLAPNGAAFLTCITADVDEIVWTDLQSLNTSINCSYFVESPGLYELCGTNTESGCTVCDTVTVFLPVFPEAETVGDSVAITCAQEIVMLDGTGSTIGDTITYTWELLSGEGDIVLGEENNLMPNVTGPGLYQITVRNNINLCPSTDTIHVVDHRVFPSTIINGGAETETLACEDNIVLNANAGDNSANVVYEWFDLGETSLFVGANFSVSALGSYVLVASDTLTGCVGSDTIVVVPNADFPVLTVTPAIDSSLTCLVDSIEFLAIVDNVTDGFLFTWTASGGGQIQPGTETTLMPIALTAGLYQLEVTDTTTNCVALAEITITDETGGPTANAGPDLALNCFVMTDTLIGAMTTMGDDITYTWTNEAGDIISTDSFAIVSDEGTYCLEVLNVTTGCSSSDCADVVVDGEMPVLVATDFQQSLTCTNDTLLLTPESITITSPGGGYTTLWTSTEIFLGDATSDTIRVTIDGVYNITVTDTITGCQGEIDYIIGRDTISPIANAGLDTAFNCLASMLTLGGDNTAEGDDISYTWTNIIDGEVPSPNDTKTIDIITSGTYELVVTNAVNGCMSTDIIVVGSDFSEPDISITSPDEITCDNPCIDLTGTVVDLTDFEAAWTTIDGGTPTPIDELITSVCDTGSYILTVTNNLNGCFSADTITVTGDITAPIIEFATVEPFTCADTAIEIDASASGDLADFSTIAWTTITGGNVTPATGALIVSVDEPGDYALQLINTSNGCEAIDTITVESQIELPIADAGADTALDCGEIFTLDGNNSSAGMDYLWTSIEGTLTGDLTSLTPMTEGSGIHVLTVTNPDTDCESSDTITLTIMFPPAAMVMPDTMLCGDSLAISANLPSLASGGVWTTNTTAIINLTDVNNSIVTQLAAGENILIWTLSAPSDECQNYSSDTLRITSEVAPIANNDLIAITEDSRDGFVNVLLNDITNGSSVTMTILTEPEFGQIDSLVNGVLYYSVGIGASGETTINYQICNDNCPDKCDEATILITVPVDLNVPEVPNTITSNGDGINDLFIIDILANNAPDEFPDNELLIFNRWGDIVYESKPYNNNWDGKNSNGQDLPEATYYYILRLNISKGEILRGDITIIR